MVPDSISQLATPPTAAEMIVPRDVSPDGWPFVSRQHPPPRPANLRVRRLPAGRKSEPGGRGCSLGGGYGCRGRPWCHLAICSHVVSQTPENPRM